jgi:hypothetical protein
VLSSSNYRKRKRKAKKHYFLLVLEMQHEIRAPKRGKKRKKLSILGDEIKP